MRNPRTVQEWEDAVDAAQALLLLDSARRYGLVTGSPRVNVARCEALLKQGRKQGYRPRAETLHRLLLELEGISREMRDEHGR
jgi:hypothetical protein